ncbi:TetR/AcrR family transcriptional regulator [Luteolibacter sp. AS25]|uniref:TetR/AcrR family transcriptional regulator n=1 Tax=Luteolibacter sp. AS25 TaxID=3135776 RepID=UPI00398AF254
MGTPHTKERILDAAEEIMWNRGFHAVGLNEILKAVGVPKGSFYHYFKSKEEFGVELLKHYMAAASTHKRLLLSPEIPDEAPLQRLVELMENSIDRFEKNNKRYPCLVLKLASEVTDLSDSMRQVLEDGLGRWMDLLSGVFEEAKRIGQIPDSVDPMFEAGLYRDLWAGSIQRATICKSTQPMRDAYRALSERFTALQQISTPAASAQ